MVTAEWWERLQKQCYNREFQGHLIINYVFQRFLLNRAHPSYFYHCLLCDRISPQELEHKVADAAVDESGI